MSDRPKLTTPLVRVVMDDGAELTVQCLNIDLLAFDRERPRRGWPPAQEAPISWLNYLAWHALKREGSIPNETTLADFERNALEVGATEETEIPPTLTGPEVG